MDPAEDYVFMDAPQSSYPPPAPPVAYLPPSAPSHNPYGPPAFAPHSSISPPSHYPPNSLNTYSSYVSNPFSPQAFYPQTFYDDVPIEALNFLQSTLDKVKGLTRMADPLSVIASVVAITAAAVQVSQTLYKLADTIGGTNSEVESIAFEVETFSSVLDDLRDLLDDSEDLITPKALKNANSILSRCKGIFETIQQMLAPYKHADRISFWHGIQWTFKRERVKPMRCRLEALKTSLLVWLGTVKLARHRSQPAVDSPSSIRKDSRYLLSVEKSIVKNSKAIVRWERAEAEANQPYNPYGPSYPLITQGSTQPSKEIRWISSLVPYAQNSASEPWKTTLRLEGRKTDADYPKGETRIEILKTVNVLLAKWTTLQVPIPELVGAIAANRKTEKSAKKPRKVNIEIALDDKEVHPSVEETEPSKDRRRPGLKSTKNASETAPTRRGDHATEELSDDGSSVRPSQSASINGQSSTSSSHKSDIGGGAGWHKATISDLSREERSSNPLGTNNIDDRTGDEYDDKTNLSNDGVSPMRTTSPYANGGQDSASSEENWTPARSVTVDDSGTPSDLNGFNYGYPPPMPSYMGGPQAGYAQTLPSQSRPQSHMIAPYGPMPPPHQPFAPSPYGLPYPNANLYTPASAPAPPAPAPPGESTQSRANEDRDQDARLKRIEEVILKEKEERLELSFKEKEKRFEMLIREQEERGAREEARAAAAAAALKAKEEEVARAKMMAERSAAEAATKAKEETEAKKRPEESGVVHLKDAIGRKLTFPFKSCRNWSGIEELIRLSFRRIEGLEPHVADGHYDLIDPNGAIVLPQVWDALIQPDWTITMRMWPRPELVESTKKEPATNASAPGKAPMVLEPPIEELMEELSPPPRKKSQRVDIRNASPVLPPKAPPPPPPPPPRVVVAEESDAESTSRRGRSKGRTRPSRRLQRARSDNDSDSDGLLYSDSDDVELLAPPWQEVLQDSFDKLTDEFQRTWESIQKSSRAQAEREILKKWLEDASARHETSRILEASEGSPKDVARIAGRPVSEQTLGGRTSFVKNGSADQDAIRKGPPSAESDRCKECQSPLHNGTQLESRPSESSQLFTQSAPPPQAHKPLISPPATRIARPSEATSTTMAQRLEALEKLLQQQEAERQTKAKAALEEERLSRLEKALLQQSTNHEIPASLLTPPPTDAGRSPQSYIPLDAKTPSHDGGGKRKALSTRSSFRARLFGRPGSRAGSMH